jgi:predicted PhzF superfamily epimerase YddE/YHI9
VQYFLHVLRTFVDRNVSGSGAISGVVLDAGGISEQRRQRIASERRLPEIVFVDDLEHGIVQIFTASRQRPYAGYPLIATAWLLAQMNSPVNVISPPAGSTYVRYRGNGDISLMIPEGWLHRYTFEQYQSVKGLRQIDPPSDNIIRWAWQKEKHAGIFARFTIPDHAPGSGVSAAISAALGFEVTIPLVIRQGNHAVCEVLRYEDFDGVWVSGAVVLEYVTRL